MKLNPIETEINIIKTNIDISNILLDIIQYICILPCNNPADN